MCVGEEKRGRARMRGEERKGRGEGDERKEGMKGVRE
jgi:hypothetical protein